MKMKQIASVFFLLLSLTSCTSYRPVVFEKPQFFVVNIDGALNNPGEFHIKPYATLEDVLEEVDLREDSDISSFNMKMILKHHDKITIPKKHEEPCININHGTLEQLMKLTQIGEVIASRIIEYRNQHGFFQHIQDIMFVKGVGEKTFENNKQKLCL